LEKKAFSYSFQKIIHVENDISTSTGFNTVFLSYLMLSANDKTGIVAICTMYASAFFQQSYSFFILHSLLYACIDKTCLSFIKQ